MINPNINPTHESFVFTFYDIFLVWDIYEDNHIDLKPNAKLLNL